MFTENVVKKLCQLVLLCVVSLSCGINAAEDQEPAPAVDAAEAAQDAAPQLKPGTSYVFLRGHFPLRADVALFQTPTLTRAEMRQLLEKTFARETQRVVIDCSAGAFLSATIAESFAALIRQQKKQGQLVSCVVDGATDADMIVAAACDEVICLQASFHAVDGIAMYMDYYADALQKLGVTFHAVTSGPEKTAPEFLTKRAPSPAAIAESTKLMHALDDNLLLQSQRQHLNALAIKAARELAPQSSAQLVASGLADKVVELGAWQEQLPQPLTVMTSKEKQPDVSSFAGMMAFWSQLMRGPQDKTPKSFIAVLELEGSIVDGDGSESGLITALDTVREMQDLEKDERVKAVLVRMHSGGGSATASDRIYHALKALAAAKPCVVLIEDVAASGGYYIACGAPYIMAHHASITGSIGVFAVMPDLTAMREKIGIKRHVLSTSSRATIYSTDAFDEGKRTAIQSLISDIDQRFQGIVATERKLDPAKVAQLANGKVYLAAEALGAGLIDATGDYSAAVAHLKTLIGDESLPCQRFPKQKGLAEMLGMGSMGLSLSKELARHLSMAVPRDLQVLLRQLAPSQLAAAQRPLLLCWRSIPLMH